MNTKKSLALAKNGYELLERKRNILIREMMTLIDHANAIQEKIDNAYEEAYIALQTLSLIHILPTEFAKQLKKRLCKHRSVTVEFSDAKNEIKKSPPVSYTHLDVYKRQSQSITKYFTFIYLFNDYFCNVPRLAHLRYALINPSMSPLSLIHI